MKLKIAEQQHQQHQLFLQKQSSHLTGSGVGTGIGQEFSSFPRRQINSGEILSIFNDPEMIIY